MSETLTLEKVLRMKRDFDRSLREIKAAEPPRTFIAAKNGDTLFGGMQIVLSPFATVLSDRPTFPVSRHRSRRIHKKLERRHGPQFPQLPASYEIGGRLHMHPAIWDQIKRNMS